MFSMPVIEQARSSAGETTDASSFSSANQGSYRGPTGCANTNALSGFHVPSVLDIAVISPIVMVCHRRDRLHGRK